MAAGYLSDMDFEPEWMVQGLHCKAKQLPAKFKNLPRCMSCHAKNTDECRFIGFRAIRRVLDADADTHVSFRAEGEFVPRFSWVYNRLPTSATLASTMYACAKLLLPVLKREQQHCSDGRAIFRSWDTASRPICDICSSELFSETWFCTKCGMDLCHECVLSLEEGRLTARQVCPSSKCKSSSHTRLQLLPLTRFSRDELDGSVASMTSLLDSFSTAHIDQSLLDLTFLSYGDFTDLEFRAIWEHGVPIVITGVDKRMQGRWTPADFIADYGLCQVNVVDCMASAEATGSRYVTMAEFFTVLSASDDVEPHWKIKDWPEERNFKSACPELYEAFCKSIPCPDIACPNGILNLAGHCVANHIAPDLGPKLYVAPAAQPGTATTKLHMDITDAVNLMVWSAAPHAPSAHWDIFSADSAEALRRFMKEEFGEDVDIDPIHSQRYYLTDEMITRLLEDDQHRVRHWRVEQRVGDAIFIPAGCAHQVVNVSTAVKIACDFVSAENLKITAGLVPSLRAERLRSHTDDILQLYTTVWFAWVSVKGYTGPVDDDRQLREDRTQSSFPSGISALNIDQDPHDESASGRFVEDEISRAKPDAHSTDVLGSESSTSYHLAVENRHPQPAERIAERGVDATDRLEARRQLRQHKKAAKMYGQRRYNPAHTYPCEHPQCEGMFNRRGLLQHMKQCHPDFYGVPPKTVKYLICEGKCDVNTFWRVLRSTHLIPPEQGRLLPTS
ncbi:hypothetical protein C8T65DRAFT_643779 [Cerioporus squamosus]|nr:hypothetical protein C8T65DRAFT_643779 [Cerioporus squamosus]